MRIGLTPQQKKDRATFRALVEEYVIPRADDFDCDQRIPSQLIRQLAQERIFRAAIGNENSGAGMDMITLGLLHEEIGRGYSSLNSILTVHSMAAAAIQRWGSKDQREHWLPRIASGEILVAFGLTEPDVGSDAKNIKTRARLSGDYYIVDGIKKWITAGQIADLFLIFAQCEDKPSAFLVERSSARLSIEPISGMYGLRASMLAELRLEGCRIPKQNLVGRVGLGFSHVAASALDHGRYCVAWGCVGIARACLEASVRYANGREQFGAFLKDHQLVQRMLTDMITNVEAARLLCYKAGYLKDTRDPRSVLATSIAKYFASTIATKAANDAVQIHGANGCSDQYPVQRYLRDAKIMEIIEGSTQIQQITISKYGQHEYLTLLDNE